MLDGHISTLAQDRQAVWLQTGLFCIFILPEFSELNILLHTRKRRVKRGVEDFHATLLLDATHAEPLRFWDGIMKSGLDSVEMILITFLCSCLFSGWRYFAEATEAGPKSEVKKARQESSQTAGGSSGRHAGLHLRQHAGDGQTGQHYTNWWSHRPPSGCVKSLFRPLQVFARYYSLNQCFPQPVFLYQINH